MSFGEISKMLRREYNFTQIQLAEALRVSKSCISMIEIGKNEPTSSTLAKYADYFQVSADFLLERENSFNATAAQPQTITVFEKQEKELLNNYRSLNNKKRKAAREFLQALSED